MLSLTIFAVAQAAQPAASPPYARKPENMVLPTGAGKRVGRDQAGGEKGSTALIESEGIASSLTAPHTL